MLVRHSQGARQACRGDAVGVEACNRSRIQESPRPETGRRRLRAARVGSRQPWPRDAAQKPPDHPSHPAADRPKLCSMNAKSVSTCEPNTRLKTPKFTNDAARSLQKRSESLVPGSSQ